MLKEPIIVVMPSDDRMASREAIGIHEIADETFLGMSKTAPSLRAVIDDYLKRRGVPVRVDHEIDNLSMAISLVASTRGVTLVPAYTRNFLALSVISPPLAGETPTVDLVIGYHEANPLPILKPFLARSDDLIASVARRAQAARSA